MAKGKGKAKGMIEVNMIPLRDTMITTANVVKSSGKGIVTSISDNPTFMNVQQVLAIGPTVNGSIANAIQENDIKIGDWIYLDMSQYLKTVTKQSELKAGVGGGKYQVEELQAPVWAAPGGDNVLFKISVREIEGKVKDYSKLPDYLKESETVEDFVEAQRKVREETQKAAEKLNKKTNTDAVMEKEGQDYPAIYTEGKFRA